MPLASLDICKCWAHVLSLSFRLISLALIYSTSLSRSLRLSLTPGEHRACGRAPSPRLSPCAAPPPRLSGPRSSLLERLAARLLPRGAGPARSAAAASCFLSARGAAGQGPRAAGVGPERGRRAAPRSCRERPARGQEALARCRGGARKGPRTTGAATRQGLNLVW